MIGESELELVLGGDAVMAHDDRLLLRGQKHEVGLSVDWWKRTVGNGNIYGWFNTLTREVRQPEYWSLVGDDRPPLNWAPMEGKLRKLADGVTLYAEGSFMELRLGNLWEDMRKRYRLSLEAILDAEEAGIIHYRGKAEQGSRGRQEALRHRLRTHWRAVEYEHNLLFTGEVAESLMSEAREAGLANGWPVYNDTVYAKGYHTKAKAKDRPSKVKVYRLTKHGLPNVVKLEVTLRGYDLRKHGLELPERWEQQPDTQGRIMGVLMRDWRKVLAHMPETRRRLAGELEVGQGELFHTIAGNRNTLTDRVRRLEQDMERVKKHIGLEEVDNAEA